MKCPLVWDSGKRRGGGRRGSWTCAVTSDPAAVPSSQQRPSSPPGPGALRLLSAGMSAFPLMPLLADPHTEIGDPILLLCDSWVPGWPTVSGSASQSVREPPHPSVKPLSSSRLWFPTTTCRGVIRTPSIKTAIAVATSYALSTCRSVVTVLRSLLVVGNYILTASCNSDYIPMLQRGNYLPEVT